MQEIKLLHPNDIDINNDIIIDIRREEEFLQTGTIPNSIKLTFFKEDGNYDLSSWLREFKKHVNDLDTKFVLVCAHAHRTSHVGNYLVNELKYTNAYHLKDGMALWLSLDKKTLFK